MSIIGSASDSLSVLRRQDSVLLVIDVQERLLPAAANKETLINNIVRLLRFARIINLPVVLTEQDRLGATVPEIKNELPDVPPIVKVTFDAFGCDPFVKHLESLGKKTLILTGLETHICISQTALHAASRFRVHVVSDAVTSRTLENWRVGLDRMRQAGVVVSSTEMAIYELLERAGTDEFRATLKLVK
ncbi:MAG: hydrolase [Chloroflexi bacterium]|nr:hydrolase [Chloroflexota bacterium]